MSGPRLISPLLDGFVLGGAISDRSGVRCYPAMRQDSDERYIVKTISIPASQVQLDALLLTGAYPDAEAARGYFQDRAIEVREEVEILNKLAAQRGFLPIDQHQIVAMEEGVGYEVYLVSPYKPTLERHLKRQPMTHLSAVNMGIDLCAALSVCREAGYLYVGLKPDNIILPGQQEYYIGDLGFVALNALNYASLPDRCRSLYTPPEIADAYAQLGTTMDTYALGLVLYQVYNNGQLPFDSEESRQAVMESLAKGELLPPPAYADYEMAQILQKACAYDPADRYQTPEEMGHALIAYMQRNEVDDVPIAPPVLDEPPILVEEEPDVPETKESQPEGFPVEESEEITAPEPVDEPVDESAGEEVPEEKTPEEEPAPETELPGEDPEEDAPADEDWIDRMDAILGEDTTEEPAPAEPAEEEPSLRELLTVDEDEQEEAEQISTEDLSGETADILNLAQELIEHEAPQPAVAPEPIDVPIPEPIVLPDDPEEPCGEESAEEPEETSDVPELPAETPAEQAPAEEPVPEPEERKPFPWKRVIIGAVTAALLAVLAFGAWYAYNNIYLQHIDAFTVDGQADELVVSVDTDMDESLLTVVCTDTAGNSLTGTLTDGKTTFTGLNPGSQYTVTLQVSGSYKLTGSTSPCVYYTPAQTQIVSFSVTTGAEDGSAVVSFGVEGPDSTSWTLHYWAEGEEEQALTFSGHTANVTGLTIGSTYTFTLTADDEIYLAQAEPVSFTATEVIFAQDITVTGNADGSITVNWTAPEGVTVSGWVARCYNQDGFDQKLDVTETTATFTNVEQAAGYTIEITAAGMIQSKIVYITANSVTITNVSAQVENSTKINISWSFEGVAPENGWIVVYTVDGSTEQQVIKTTAASAAIALAAPGSHYDIVVQPADSISVFGGAASVDVPAITKNFSGYRITAADIALSTYAVPENKGWTWNDLGSSVSTFSPGGSMAVLYRTTAGYNVSYNEITALFVIRDSEGKLVSMSTNTRTWKEMWNTGRCTETISNLPTTAGSYTLEIYLNNAKLGTVDFKIE